MSYTFSPVSWATSKKTRWATTYTKKLSLFCPTPPNFRGGPKKVGHTHSTKCQVLAVFFFPSGKKVPMKSFFGRFFDFSQAITFFTSTFRPKVYLFHAHFCVSRVLFSNFLDFFNGEQISISRLKLCVYKGILYSFTGIFCNFFSRAHFQENFHGLFSWVFQVFSRAFTFHGHKISFLSRLKFDHTREKKSTVFWYICNS